MGLKLSKSFNLSNLAVATGEYWTIKNYQYDKGDKFLAVFLELYKDKQEFKQADSVAVHSVVMTFSDVVFDYKEIEKTGNHERKEVYRYVLEEVPNEIKNNAGLADAPFLENAADDL